MFLLQGGQPLKYVIGVDLGTSAVKLMLVNQQGYVVQELSKSYPLIQEQAGHSEQDPEDWASQTISGLSELVSEFEGNTEDIKGLSFSGQMHGLVLIDKSNQPLRNAILWNDTRTSEECDNIYKTIGEEKLLSITKNQALEGFTLPKILWVKKHEPEIFKKAEYFLLPKDYVRYRLTGEIHSDYSDAAGTLLLDIQNKIWSSDLCASFDIDSKMCPPLAEASEKVGSITEEVADLTGLSTKTVVFAGGADNACGAIGSGILEKGKTMVSIGTSGVLLTYENDANKDFQGKVHYFNHAAENAYYTMGVTLAAGHSLSWFKNTFAKDEEFDNLLNKAQQVPIGSNGLLFAPYISGERTPHIDANIRGSFLGIDVSHQKEDFIRSVIEGITFSLSETLEIFRKNGKNIDTIISIGGGAKSKVWLQIQADIFNTDIITLQNEQGPGMGASILAAYGVGWFPSLKECHNKFNVSKTYNTYTPNTENVHQYKKLFASYKQIYNSTKKISHELMNLK